MLNLYQRIIQGLAILEKYDTEKNGICFLDWGAMSAGPAQAIAVSEEDKGKLFALGWDHDLGFWIIEVE